MKNLKSVLAAFAFVLAIGAAVASSMTVEALSRIEVLADQGAVRPDAECQDITITTDCDEISSQKCDIASGATYYRYFKNTGCNTELKKP